MEKDEKFSTEISKNFTVIDFFAIFSENWKMILGFALVGLIGSGIYLTITPPQYEATAMLEMGQIGVYGNNGNVNAVANVEEPAMLLARLKIPSAYLSDAIKACDVSNNTIPGESLARLVHGTQRKELGAIVVVSVLRDKPDQAKTCMSKIFEMIRDQQQSLAKPSIEKMVARKKELQERLRQNKEYMTMAKKSDSNLIIYLDRRNDLLLLAQQVDELEQAVLRSSATRLVSPVYVSPNPTFPKRGLTLALSMIFGLIIGSFFAFGRSAVKRHYAR